jgi:biopolymer transport protein TolR
MARRILNPSARAREMSEINVTSLVDVVLVLLIIFMLSTPFLQGGVDVSLPSTRTVPVSATEGPVISLDKNRKVYLDDDDIALNQLSTALAAIHPPDDPRPVYLRCDEDVPYGFVVRVMGEIKSAGITTMSLVVKPERD